MIWKAEADIDFTAAALTEAWDTHLRPVRSELPFTRAKSLLHRIFDAADVPRPFVKCMPIGDASFGFATEEHEVFLREHTFDDTVIRSASQLLLGPVETDLGPGSADFRPLHFENYLYLAYRYTQIHHPSLAAYASAVSDIFHVNIAPRLTIGRTHSHWANISPGHELYQTAIGTGCRLFKRHGEPEPQRDAR